MDELRVQPPDERDVPTGAAALAKGLYLLDVIGERSKPPRFRDLQAATGLPKGTLARLLNTLVLYRCQPASNFQPPSASNSLPHVWLWGTVVQGVHGRDPRAAACPPSG